MDDHQDRVETKEIDLDPDSALCLVVVADGAATTYQLPEEGAVVIGRADDAEVHVSHGSVSREHARLYLGGKILLEDLGSSNGTRVGGRILKPGEPIEIQVDDAVDLGGAMIVVQYAAAEAGPTRVISHEVFVGQTSSAVEQADPFAVLRLQVQAGVPPAAMRAALATKLRRSDRIAEFAPNDYEILLHDSPPSEARDVVGRLASALERAGVVCRTGLACCPSDCEDATELLALAGERLQGDANADLLDGQIVLKNSAMKELYDLAERAAGSPVSVLLLGETGVGKDVLAGHIHRRSPRADHAFLKLNCAALAETLLESELFGHERGSFTGATQQKTGLLETAHGGTVFLDEVGELSLPLQAKLLRAIEEKEILPVGGLEPRHIDVRFVAATNCDIEADAARGAFRQDLYFRLNGMTLVVPPLRERTEEIEPLAYAFLARVCERQGFRSVPSITSEAMGMLRSHSWPGNIRELRNAIERAAILSQGGDIDLEYLPVDHMATAPPNPVEATQTQARSLADADGIAPRATAKRATEQLPSIDLREEIENMERQRIVEALDQCDGNQTQAAKLLSISRSMLLRRLDHYGIPRPRKADE